MVYEWKDIKAAIGKETKEVFETDKSFNIAEALEMFRKVLDYPISEPILKLESLPDLMQTINSILIESEVSGANFNNLAQPFEAYLKKILYLTDPNYYAQNADNLTLGDNPNRQGLISKLSLNPNNIRYHWPDLSANQKTNFAEHLWRAYNLRNTLAHFCKSYNRKQFWDGVQSYLVMYLWAAYKHRQAILAAVEPYFLSNYLKKYIASYQHWQRLFIPIEGVERPELLENYAVEVPEEEQHRQGESIQNQGAPPDGSKKNRPLPQPKRSGSVMDLRNIISEKRMVIVAEPGMGKSTALQFMAYTDAKAIEAGTEGVNYPVYIELKEFQSKDSIKEWVIQQLGIAAEVTEGMLKDGKITLLLDGLNETAQGLRDEAVNAIRRFMIDYPQVLVIITCRPNAYERNYFDSLGERGKTPIFQLQPMGMAQIEEFLVKYSSNETVRNTILQALQNNENLSKVVETPLLLKMLIAVVSRHPKEPIPPTETRIVLNFIEGIYQREAEKDAGFKPDTLQTLLPILAHQIRMCYQANVAIPEAEAVKILKDEAPKWEIKAALKKAEELHILVCNPESNRYSYAHELYQEALWAVQQTQYDQYSPEEPYYKPAIELWQEPAFAQSLRLYAGLLTGNKRKDFIKEVAKRNAYLAARCTTAYWLPEEDVVQMVVERAKLFASLFSWESDMSADGFMALIELNDKGAIIAVLQQEKLGQSSFLKKLFEGLKPKQVLDFIFLLLKREEFGIVKKAILQVAFKEGRDLIAEAQIKKLIEELFSRQMYEEVLVIDSMTKILILSEDQYKRILGIPELKNAGYRMFEPYINRNVLLKYINNYTPPFETIKDWLKRLFLVSEEHNYYNFKEFPLEKYPNERSKIIEIMSKDISYDFQIEEIIKEYNLSTEEILIILKEFSIDAYETYGSTIDEDGKRIGNSYNHTMDDLLRLTEDYLPGYTIFINNDPKLIKEILGVIHPADRVKWIQKYNFQTLYPIEDCITEAINNIIDKNTFRDNDIKLVEEALGKEYVTSSYWNEQIIRLIEAKQFLIAYKIAKKYINLHGYLNNLVNEATQFILIWDWNKVADKRIFTTRIDEDSFERAYVMMQEYTKDNDIIPHNEQYEGVQQLLLEIKVNDAIKKIIEYDLYNLVSLDMILRGDIESKPNNDDLQVREFDIEALENEDKHLIALELMIDGDFEKVVELCNLFKIKPFFEPEPYLDAEEERNNRSKIFSGHSMWGSKHQKSKIGLFEFITKSVNPQNQALHQIIRQFLNRGKFDVAKQLIIYYAIEDIEINRLFVQEAIKSNHYIFADRWIKLQFLQEHFNSDDIIKAALENSYILVAKQLSEDNNRQEQFPITVFIDAILEFSKIKQEYESGHILSWALNWILESDEFKERYCNIFLERALIQDYYGAKYLFEVFEGTQSLDIDIFINNAINVGREFEFVVEIIDKHDLKSKYNFIDLFYRYIINSWDDDRAYYNKIDKYNVGNRLLIATAYLKHFCYSDGRMPHKYAIKVEGNIWGGKELVSYLEYDKYQITESEIIEAINFGLHKKHVDLVKLWVELAIYAKADFPMTSIIQTAIDTNQSEVAEYWVQKYNLYHEFPQFEPPAEALEEENSPPEGI